MNQTTKIAIIITMVISFIILMIIVLTQVPKKSDSPSTPTIETEESISNNGSGIQGSYSEPIQNATSRVTKKSFGTYVTPQNSPVSPERFSGYHNAVDFEVTDAEQNEPIPVYALCDGNLQVKQTVTGYGGLLIQSCVINSNPVTVLYGHINLSTVSIQTGSEIASGDQLGLLAEGYSAEAGGERKHLHLGIHKGSSIVYSGYAPRESELSNWIDVMTLLQ